eukprot:31017-Pelagococcus_subviridis.AAC.9
MVLFYNASILSSTHLEFPLPAARRPIAARVAIARSFLRGVEPLLRLNLRPLRARRVRLVVQPQNQHHGHGPEREVPRRLPALPLPALSGRGRGLVEQTAVHVALRLRALRPEPPGRTRAHLPRLRPLRPSERPRRDRSKRALHAHHARRLRTLINFVLSRASGSRAERPRDRVDLSRSRGRRRRVASSGRTRRAVSRA